MSRRALVVGVETYTHDKSIDTLPAARIDVEQITKVLTDRGEFTVTPLHNPTKTQLEHQLELLLKNRSGEDTVLVYFAGHGLTDDDKKDLYLATSDTRQAWPDSSAVDGRTLRRLFVESHAGKKLLFLDCCFAGKIGNALRSRSGTTANVKAKLGAKGTFMLTASDRIGYSFEDPQAPDASAFFTRAVVEALSGKASDTDNDGWISMQDVTDYVLRHNGIPDGQQPLMFAEGVSGAIPVARAQHPTPNQQEAADLVATNDYSEPPDDPTAELDAPMWRRLIEYYLDCLRHQDALSTLMPLNDHKQYAYWPKGPETVLCGDGKPFRLPERLMKFLRRNQTDLSTFFYGYPVVLTKDKGKSVLAPLLLAELVVDRDGVAEVDSVQLNQPLLEKFELDRDEITQRSTEFAARFRHSDSAGLTTLLTKLIETTGLPTGTPINTEDLLPQPKSSPFIEGAQNTAIVFHGEDSGRINSQVRNDFRHMLDKLIPRFPSTALAALSHRERQPVAELKTLVAPGPLNESQEEIIRSAMTKRLTVATGPPGTGKTALIAALGATVIANGQTMVVGSTNNEAVNGVTEKTNAHAPGSLIRTGSRQVRSAEPHLLSELLNHVKPPSSTKVEEGRLRNLAERIRRSRELLDYRNQLEVDLFNVERDIIRMSRDFSGESLLAMLKAAQPKLDRAARRTRAALRRLPHGIWSRRWLRNTLHLSARQQWRDAAQLLELERARRTLVTELSEQPDGVAIWRDLTAALATRIRLSKTVAREAVNERLFRGRDAVEARIEQISTDQNPWTGFPKLLRFLPGWATTGHSARALPPHPARFDLVVIDEAAQCPTPMVLALLMRAKRALIIGDPHQIPPIHSISRSDDDRLRRKNGLGAQWLSSRQLGFVSGSIYHACAAAAGEVTLLDEHYRCDPEIIATPNRVVYKDRLAVLTDVSGLTVPATPKDPAVQIIDVPGHVKPSSSRSSYNPDEITAVAATVDDLRDRFPNAGIGVVAPFRAQVDQLRKRLPKTDAVKVGTVHTFQGDQRDIIVLSPVGSDGIGARSSQWIQKQTNLWNVAITRAQSKLVVVCDSGWWNQHPSLLTTMINGRGQPPPRSVDHTLIDRLQGACERQGLDINDGDVVLAGKVYDLIVSEGDKKYAMFVDDNQVPDGRRFRQFLATLDLVDGQKYHAVRVPAWRCLSDANLEKYLGELLS